MKSRYRWGPIGNKGSHRLSTLLPFSWRYTVKPPTEPTGPTEPTEPTENTEQGSLRWWHWWIHSHFWHGDVVHWLICIFTCSRGNVFALSAGSWPWNIFAGLGRASICSSHLLHQRSWLGTEISFRWAAALRRAESCSGNCCSMLWSACVTHSQSASLKILEHNRFHNRQHPTEQRQRTLHSCHWLVFLSSEVL